MLACVDVDYRDNTAVAGCVLFHAWTDDRAAEQVLTSQKDVAPYRPGRFYLRELPPILAVLSLVRSPIETVVVDGYVWLSATRIGLGAHLYTALDSRISVIGVAKKAWRSETNDQATKDHERRVIPVIRGGSKSPLYITSAGLDVGLAASLVGKMHGAHRIPTLLAAVDRLVRSEGKVSGR